MGRPEGWPISFVGIVHYENECNCDFSPTKAQSGLPKKRS